MKAFFTLIFALASAMAAGYFLQPAGFVNTMAGTCFVILCYELIGNLR